MRRQELAADLGCRDTLHDKGGGSCAATSDAGFTLHAGESAMSGSKEHETPHLTIVASTVEAEPRSMSAGDLIDEPALAARLGVSRSTLQSWRYAGRGPRYIKLGRMIRYRNDDVDAYLRANTRGKVA